MRTNIDIDEEVMQYLLESTGLQTKKEVVERALRELLRKKAREELLSLEGKIHFWPGYDPEESDGKHDDWAWPDDEDHS